VQCIRNYFRKKFDYESERFPSFADVMKEEGIDVEVEASGFTREMQRTFDEALEERNKDCSDTDSDDDDVDSETEKDGTDDAPVPGCHFSSTVHSLLAEDAVDIVGDFAWLMSQSEAVQPPLSPDATENSTTAGENPHCDTDSHSTDVPETLSETDSDGIATETADDSLGGLANQNRAARPFRDIPVEKPLCSGDEIPDSGPEIPSSSKPGIDVRVVKQKIKTQHQQQQAKQAARRTIKRGEAAAVTRVRRHNNETIQHRAGWDF